MTDETPNESLPITEPGATGASPSDADATSAAAPGTDPSQEPLLEALRQVIDPELFVNVVDLGLIYGVERREEGKVAVDMTLTSPACPAGPQLVHQSKSVLERLDDVEEAEIRLVMTPPWSPDRMTDDARDQLGIF